MKLCFGLVLLLTGAHAQLSYLATPKLAWTGKAGSVEEKNGMFVFNNNLVIGSFLDGTLQFYNAKTGQAGATYVPDNKGSSLQGLGGVTMSTGGTTPYVVYAVTDNPTTLSAAKT
jgi:hypothetical protein